LALPTYSVTGGVKNQAAAPVRVWNFAAGPDLLLDPAGSSLEIEVGFQATGGNILSVVTLPNEAAAAAPAPMRVEYNNQPGERIFGWEPLVDVGGGNMKAQGVNIQTTQAAVYIAANLFATAGNRDLFTITTDASVTNLTWGGAYTSAGAYLAPNGTLQGTGFGRIAQTTGATTATNYDIVAGSLAPNLTLGGAGTWFLGDMNGNGSVTSLDTSRFNQALFDPTTYKTNNPNLNILRADMNGSGTVTSLDTARYNNILFGTNGQPQGSGSGLGGGGSVPEPASVTFLGLALAFAAARRRRSR
jgi:hypothetical protein